MTSPRSRLVRVVAERLGEHSNTFDPAGLHSSDMAIGCACGERSKTRAARREHVAEVVVAAVLDELGEGPLHDAMFGAAWEDFCVVDPVPVVTEADPFTLLFWRGKVRGAVNAALSVARTWNEEE